MFRVVPALALAAALIFPTAAAGARLTVRPKAFSPWRDRVIVEAALPKPLSVGIALARRDGQRLGWLAYPTRRRSVAHVWTGRLRKGIVPDSVYVLELATRKRVLARARVRVDASAPKITDLGVASAAPFAGDHALLATVTPNGDGLRDRATVSFRVNEPATVSLAIYTTKKKVDERVWAQTRRLRAGVHAFAWSPPPETPPRTYLVAVTATDGLDNVVRYGRPRPFATWVPRGPVVRVRGVDASFAARSYAPGEQATLTVATDAKALTLEVFRAGPEAEPTERKDEMKGIAVAPPVSVDWSAQRHAPAQIPVPIGPWATGLYFARLTADDGRVGFAPFVVRASAPGPHRVAVVLPTNTWAAYNEWDADGDGWGDTWYVSRRIRDVDPARPFLHRGVPPKFLRDDLGFIRWLAHTGKGADFLTDDDLARVGSGEELAAAYNLLVFPGHEEYVSGHVYDVVERFRDLGGNLVFLSANNFWRRVEWDGPVITVWEPWRDVGRPEARLIGVQYVGNGGEAAQAPYVVTGAAAAPWFFAGTELRDGSTFGRYGIEIDARTPDSPPGIQVLARIPELIGWRSGEMTYYETAAGAKVFAAGSLNFGGSAEQRPVSQLLENLWVRLSAP